MFGVDSVTIICQQIVSPGHNGSCCLAFGWVFDGEFDPGSGRTLAACLTHASRAVRPFGVHERRTGE